MALAPLKFSALAAASALGGTEQMPGVQGGLNVAITPAQVVMYIIGLANAWGRKQTITPVANENALAVTGYSLTGANAQSLVDLAGTWNTTGTPTAINLNITDTASNAASQLFNLAVGGTSKFSIDKTGLVTTGSSIAVAGNIVGSGNVRSSSNTGQFILGASQDIVLNRDAADILALRRSTNAQTFRVYNSYTDASNYERGDIVWNANVLEIGTAFAGTGTARALRLKSATGAVISIDSGGSSRWQFTAAGNLNAVSDNTLDIGANGANRPRHGFFGNTLNAATGGGFGVVNNASAFGMFGASITTRAHLNLAAGVAPTTPNNGDIWFDGTNIKMQIGGATKTFTLV